MQKLLTAEGEIKREIPWKVYPRPQMKRERWLCLNGIWDISYNGRHKKIIVPFCAESQLSGLTEPPAIGTEMKYSRLFTVPESWQGSRILLRFGAVSRDARVSVNGKEIAHHEQAYLPFALDITDELVPGENKLEVKIINDLNPQFPWGKQKIDRGGMWYTPCSGIWQTVWLEPVPDTYISALRIDTDLNSATITVASDSAASGYVDFQGMHFSLQNDKVTIPVEDPTLWTPEHPQLYSFTLHYGEDTVESYFALRTLSVREFHGIPRLCLNEKPYFFHGLLDQGYWSDGLYTPAAPECYEKDILAMKELGFNTLRKHIKIEPEQFYFDCDRLGMIVFQDMVNSGEYSFFKDTAMPTIHLTKFRDQNRHSDPVMRRNFLDAMEETVMLLRNHPSICYWTIFNEGWGQFCADESFDLLKQLDDSRFIDATSGWFKQKCSDVESQHIYFGKIKLGKEKRPQVLSEYGGYSYKIPEHSFNLEKTYGYQKYADQPEYENAVIELFESLIPLVKDGLCAAIYTQVSDVEDETNGLLTFDRRERKIAPDRLKKIGAELQSAMEEKDT